MTKPQPRPKSSILTKTIKIPGVKWALKTAFIVTACFMLVAITTGGGAPSGFLDEREISSAKNSLGTGYIPKALSQPLKPDASSSLLVYGNDEKTKSFEQACMGKDDHWKPSKIELLQKNDATFISRLPFFNLSLKNRLSLEFPVAHGKDDLSLPHLIDNLIINDLDGDGFDEIIVRLVTPLCGSGGEQTQFILSAKDGYRTLSTGLPKQPFYFQKEASQTPEEITINPTAKFTYLMNGKSVTQDLPTTSADKFLDFLDLDGDGHMEMIQAFSLYEYPEVGEFYDSPQECHVSCGHKWVIGIYKYVDGRFLADNKWNNGVIVVTDKKIDLWDAFGYSDHSRNLMGLRMFNHFLCDEEPCDSFFAYTRRTPEITNEVKARYNLIK